MIIRSPRKESNFLIVQNSVVRDKRLSFKARGILLEILSRPDNWVITAENLALEGQEGRAAILTAFEELRAVGYMKTNKLRNSDGTFQTVTFVFDEPEDAIIESPRTDYPTSDNRFSLEEPIKEELKSIPQPKIRDSLFQEFWDIYPIHNGGRANSEKAWKKAVKQATPEAIIEGARKYRDDPNRQKEFTAYPATWLNQGRWADDPLPPQALKTGQRGARSLDTTPTIVPPRFDPKEFARAPLDPDKVAKIRRENGV